MSEVVLDGTTVTRFLEAKEAFEACIQGYFKTLDADGDGMLSRVELEKGFEKIFMLEFESTTKEDINKIFDTYDKDRNGKIDRDEFRSLMNEIMVTIAHGIGNIPVIVTVLDQHSLFMMVVNHELASKKYPSSTDG
ncbi:hypothetical protein SLE2022_128990 [Rubroshorea leprosula]